MSPFDPELAGKMVADYAPARPAKFQDLLPARNVIDELRQKGASYGAIAELLTRHNLTTSKTAVTVFCHEVLDAPVRPRRRISRKKESTLSCRQMSRFFQLQRHRPVQKVTKCHPHVHAGHASRKSEC